MMNEGALSEHLKGWAMATIGELVDKNGVFIDGDWVESKDQDPSGDVRLVQLADIGDGVYRNKSNRFLTSNKAVQLGCTFLKNDDVLIARMPDPLGRACLFPGDPKPCVTVVDVCIVRVSANLANNRWLMYAINSHAFRSKISSLQSGTTRKRISRGNLSKLELPLPPLPEQRVIVSKIEQFFSDLDNGIENFKKAQAQLKLYRQSVLKAACEGKLVPTEAELARAEGRDYEPADVLLARILKERREKWNGKGKYKEAEALETGELPELPEGWCWVNLEQLKSFSLYGPRYSSDDYANDGYIVLRTSDISESGKVDVSSAPRLNISKDDFSKYKVELGDLLITRTGSLGTLAVFNDNIESIPGAYLIMYRLVMNLGISWYIFYFLKSPLGQKHLIAGGAGVGRPNLNAPTIEVIPIPFPPHSEQRRIIAEVERRLSVSDKMEATIAESLQKAESLRQSILKKAFEGKLLNKKELGIARNAPDWEPAEKLLERINAEKVKAQKNKHMSGE
jgi:type I restriction enzyme S subunit